MLNFFLSFFFFFFFFFFKGSAQVELAPEDAEKVKVTQDDFLSSLDDIKPVSIIES